jgi:alpha-tubulin suppressor-like RCC1 family protein
VPQVEDVRMLVAGGLHTCALVSDGRVLCWGGHSFNHTSLTPAEVVNGIGSSKTIAAGGLQTCALSNEGEVHCWDVQYGLTPTPVKIALSARASAVAAGGDHACALSEDHRVVCWSRGGTASAAAMAPHWIEGLKGVRSISAGLNHTCAITAAGYAACWGANDSGQLGTGTTQNSDVPAQLKLHRVRAIAAGTYHTCALDTAGKLRCWGNNLTGELGTGDVGDTLSADESMVIKPF